MATNARMTFTGAIKICLDKYLVFYGRAPRAEYWYWSLFVILANIALDVLAIILDAGFHGLAQNIFSVLQLIFVLPSIAVTIRRLHDLDRSGWWWLITLVPLIGWIILLIWFCSRGTSGANRYGPDPLGHSPWVTG